MISIMSELTEALRPLLAREIELRAGSTLFRRGDPVRYLHVVEAGCVHLFRYGANGSAAVMQRALGGDVLAESSIYASRYHCDAVAVSESRLRVAEMAKIKAALEADKSLMEALARHLSGEVMRMRSRVQILALRTVQERLDGWFALNGDVLPDKGRWRLIAEDIGVSSEAFYRELKRRRDVSNQCSRSLK